ncbi:hypothetical protein AB9K35_17690 [Leisingera sp. XS_AS12]
MGIARSSLILTDRIETSRKNKVRPTRRNGFHVDICEKSCDQASQLTAQLFRERFMAATSSKNSVAKPGRQFFAQTPSCYGVFLTTAKIADAKYQKIK